MSKLTRAVVLLLLLAVPVFAQTSPSRPGIDSLLGGKGFSSYTSFEQTHDSSSTWSSVIDSSVGYQFNKVFGMAVGVPFYLTYNQVNTSLLTTNPPSTQLPLTSVTNAVGDVRLALRFSTPTPVIRYVATITGTAPTGDTSNGFSTGRATADFSNHLEFDLGRFTPLAEVGIANSNALINMLVKRPYTTLGALSHFKAGLSMPLFKGLSAEFSGYEHLPVGLQKLYSHEFSRGSSGSGSGSSSNKGPGSLSKIYQEVATAIGTGFDEDNGFSSGLNADLGKHMDLGFTYDHSVRQELDTFAVSVGIRLGKGRAK